MSDFKIKPFKKSQKFKLYNIKVEKVLNETTNLRNQYADVNNLKVVTEKSSVYGDIEINGENKKGLLNFENLDKKESKKIIGRKLMR